MRNPAYFLNFLRSNWYLLWRRDTPWKARGLLLLAALYLLSPYDLIPEWILGFGFIDDLAVVSLLVTMALRIAKSSNK